MNFDFKVLITTSGIGSRLGEFTKYTNKTLLRVGKKPVLSHIIESYPIDTKFVITLGYFGNYVKDFLELAYPLRKFEFVTVDPFQGDGSSLLFSMACAKPYLQCPFIFHASDTILTQDVPIPSKNWNAGFKGVGSSSYTSFDVSNNKVKVFYEKGNLTPDYLHVGVVGINNYKLFWEIADNFISTNKKDNSLNDVVVLREFIMQENLELFEIKEWYDIGSVEKIKIAKEKYSSNDFHVLDKVTESIFIVNGNIIKFFSDSQVSINRVNRAKYISKAVPEIIDSKPNFYKYKLVDGKLFSEVANRSNFIQLLTWAEKNLWNNVEFENIGFFKKVAYDFYYNKTILRVDQLQNNCNIKDKEEVINGILIPKLSQLLEDLDLSNLTDTIPSTFHGDFILDNIILQENDNFQLIDWRQDFGGELEAGDKYYDLAKLSHNLVINHNIIDNNQFKFEINENDEIQVNIHRLQSLVECESLYFKYLRDKNYDISKIKILRSIIWLNMSPLHHYPFNLFLYYFGKYNLFIQLKENNETV
jgi:NDP-sugar pyrophosphorylase family protein